MLVWGVGAGVEGWEVVQADSVQGGDYVMGRVLAGS